MKKNNSKSGDHSFLIWLSAMLIMGIPLCLFDPTRLLPGDYQKNKQIIERDKKMRAEQKTREQAQAAEKKAVPAVKQAEPEQKAPAVKQAEPVKKSVKAEISAAEKKVLEQRFWQIIAKAPFKFDMDHVQLAPDFLRPSRINVLTMPNAPHGIELKTQTVQLNMDSFFMEAEKGGKRVLLCTLIGPELLSLGLRPDFIPTEKDQTGELYNSVFSQGDTAENITAKLNKLEQNIGNYTLSRYHILIKLLSYTENHKLVSQNQNNIEFQIHTLMTVETTLYDKVRQKTKVTRHDLTTRTPGTQEFLSSRDSTIFSHWDRTPVFKVSSQKLYELLKKDINDFRSEK